VQLAEIVQQAQQAEAAGIQEIVLTGVQIGSWGKDLTEGCMRISDLVGALLENTSLPRMRISSIEPWDLDDGLLDRFENPRLCPHLHIPLQSGSESILRRMARPFSASDFRDLMGKIQKKRPGLAVTTDILCGFPGENEELFEESRAFVEQMDFAGGHVFKFSPMPGTSAARMDDKVQESHVQERSAVIRRILQTNTASKQAKKIGTWEEVLWEHGRQGAFSGFSRDYFRVHTNSEADLTNTISRAFIREFTPGGELMAEVLIGGQPNEEQNYHSMDLKNSDH
jgi:threonylcarbamoyladenosine tRNA methylthiotransferase MtaB